MIGGMERPLHKDARRGRRESNQREERRRQKEEIEEEISREEVKRAIKTLREGEALGVDGVP